MAKSMDDCFLSSHRIDMPIQHGRRAGPGLAMHALLDLNVRSRSASFLGQGSPSPSSMMLTANQCCRWTAPFSIRLPCIWDGCIRCSSRGPAGRLDTLQSPPCRMRHRGRHDNRGRHHRAGAEKADTPEAHKRGLRAKGPHRRLRAWGARGQTRGCPSVAGRPRFSPDDKQQPPGGVPCLPEPLWNDDRRVARLVCGCFCRSQTLCTKPGSRHAVTHGRAWIPSRAAGRQVQSERPAIRSWISVVYMAAAYRGGNRDSVKRAAATQDCQWQHQSSPEGRTGAVDDLGRAHRLRRPILAIQRPI